MDRRKSLKALMVGTVSAGALLEACKTSDKKGAEAKAAADLSAGNLDRMKEEVAHYKQITANKFFTEHEMATITILGDIIIPRDEISGSASDAKVPDFIEFIVKEKEEHQVPMRGGLRWLDLQCLNRYEKTFRECSQQQQIAMVDEIAYPEKAKPELKAGVAFFSLMRNLTASGFYTSEIGVKDIGYMGNKPNQWNGVPDDVLKQYNLAYTEKELKECISFTA
ncbi:gluconate 2-dehydrogenase subunit 3 family protein [Deminuibacter soli]|uniref:Gluconate 2-dehydrogenase subunit 3 family protein n=1 Tax=Deminuibacter soli TaxID=2291815 RepID=A0A3E1NEB0_9BACT|nr:gluconate 2-dehydrogenase subunit 3 family protein [Deminuibacter soli]RFM26315.1 gluconate 2-dehydrogenase subunit 3 family protein [Deminuibacter soli]